MFNSTHTLVGLGMARCGLGRLAPQAAWTAAIAANLPDIDLLFQWNGMVSYLAFHRGITHTVAGVAVLSILLAAVMHRISGAFFGHLLVAVVVMTTHPLLDFANTYGIRPLFPIERRWIYGDTLFVIDPYIDLLLAAGLIAGRYRPRRREFAASVALALAVGYIAVRVELRDVARRQLHSFGLLQPGYMSSAVSPWMLTPLTWTGIVDTRDEIFQVDVHVTDGGIRQERARLRKAADSRVIAAARTTPSAQALLAFARFPVIQVHSEEPGRSGYRVEFIDFRFYRPASGGAVSLAAIVELDSSLKVVRESLGFTERLEGATSASTDGSP